MSVLRALAWIGLWWIPGLATSVFVADGFWQIIAVWLAVAWAHEAGRAQELWS